MKHLVIALASLAAAGTAYCETNASAASPVVLELFSSQGCGNCPKANRNIGELSAEFRDVLPLTYSVGYWDYLGWRDSFAKPVFAERQRLYNRKLGHRGPYTPQVVIDGGDHCSGVNMKAMREKLDESRRLPAAQVAVSLRSGALELSGTPPEKVDVTLVRFRPGVTEVTPQKGDNRGKAMRHTNLVTEVQTLGQWSGGPAEFRTDCDTGCAVLLQKDGVGPILAAAAR